MTQPATEKPAESMGPIRNPDACGLACPDCACRRRLDEHLAACEREYPPAPPESTDAAGEP